MISRSVFASGVSYRHRCSGCGGADWVGESRTQQQCVLGRPVQQRGKFHTIVLHCAVQPEWEHRRCIQLGTTEETCMFDGGVASEDLCWRTLTVGQGTRRSESAVWWRLMTLFSVCDKNSSWLTWMNKRLLKRRHVLGRCVECWLSDD